MHMIDIQKIDTALQQPLLIAAKLNSTSKANLPVYTRNATIIGGHQYAVLAIFYKDHNDIDVIRRPDGPALHFQNTIMPVRKESSISVILCNSYLLNKTPSQACIAIGRAVMLESH